MADEADGLRRPTLIITKKRLSTCGSGETPSGTKPCFLAPGEPSMAPFSNDERGLPDGMDPKHTYEPPNPPEASPSQAASAATRPSQPATVFTDATKPPASTTRTMNGGQATRTSRTQMDSPTPPSNQDTYSGPTGSAPTSPKDQDPNAKPAVSTPRPTTFQTRKTYTFAELTFTPTYSDGATPTLTIPDTISSKPAGVSIYVKLIPLYIFLVAAALTTYLFFNKRFRALIRRMWENGVYWKRLRTWWYNRK